MSSKSIIVKKRTERSVGTLQRMIAVKTTNQLLIMRKSIKVVVIRHCYIVNYNDGSTKIKNYKSIININNNEVRHVKFNSILHSSFARIVIKNN